MKPILPGQKGPDSLGGGHSLFGNVFDLRNQGSVGLNNW